tara:strand:+ start:94 stop:1356 length:1263 start_codon:yes stop_codon:yes gene_type:complete
MKITKITSCRLCNCTDLIPVFDFGLQALSTRFPAKNEADAEIIPLNLVQCRNSKCNLTQLTHDYDFDDLYRKGYGYRSGVNKTMCNHLSNIVGQLEKIVELKEGDTVLDIASNDGTLLKNYKRKYKINLIGIDPTITQYRSYYPIKNTYLSSEFFSKHVFDCISPTKKAKIITSIAVFYDVPSPNNFAKDIASILDENGIWIMEQSYLPILIKDLSFDSICHEHLAYYGLKQIKLIAKNASLRVFNVETNSMNGGSLRVFMCHSNSNYKTNTQNIDLIENIESKAQINNQETFKQFKEKIISIRDELMKFINQEKQKGKKIHIYGASTKGNVLLQFFGINNELIEAAAERNEWKYGHRTPGTNIPIISEEESRALKPDYYLVLPWHFKNEFIEREKDFIDKGGRLIFPLPKVEIYPRTIE